MEFVIAVARDTVALEISDLFVRRFAPSGQILHVRAAVVVFEDPIISAGGVQKAVAACDDGHSSANLVRAYRIEAGLRPILFECR